MVKAFGFWSWWDASKAGVGKGGLALWQAFELVLPLIRGISCWWCWVMWLAKDLRDIQNLGIEAHPR